MTAATSPSAPEIIRAAALLKAGELVAFPTETVYGLGADASNADAVRKIFAAKGRPSDHPLIVHIADAVQLATVEVLRQVHAPLMRSSLLSGALLVFVDVLKELPATLVLRPFNFNTLAVRAYELASDERLADAATASLAIVLAGIIPVILLSRAITQARPGHA